MPLGQAHARSHELRHLGQKTGKEYRAGRAGSRADAVVVGGASQREVVTGDYLTLPLRGERRPRGERFEARLELENDVLIAL